jgi:hypothetical protein
LSQWWQEFTLFATFGPMEEPGIVAGGGLVERKCPPYQPKALLFKVLSFLWVIPSLTSLFILGSSWPRANSAVEFLAAVKVEQWVAAGLLLVHPVFVFLALRFRRTERFKETVLEPDPDHDANNLY